MNKGFIEQTDPPGADLQHVGEAGRTLAVYQMDMGGTSVTGSTKEETRRRAWEHWAYIVLGDRIVWSHDEEVDPEIGQFHEIYVLQGWWKVTLTHWLDDHEWELTHEIVKCDNCDGIVFNSSGTDVVEGLARMAALSIAVHGMPDGEKE
jgi:hypothetical protein